MLQLRSASRASSSCSSAIAWAAARRQAGLCFGALVQPLDEACSAQGGHEMLFSDTRNAADMRILEAGLRRTDELNGPVADPLAAILVWSAIGGIVIWALAVWKLLEIFGLAS